MKCPMPSLHNFSDLKPDTKCSLCGVLVADVFAEEMTKKTLKRLNELREDKP